MKTTLQPFEQKLIRIGLYTLAWSGILGLIAVLLLGVIPTTQQPVQWSEKVSSTSYSVSFYILIYAYLIGIMGFWAIHRLFSEERTSFLVSFWGLILCILGSTLPVISLGIYAFVYPAIGRLHLSHGVDIDLFVQNIFTSRMMIFQSFSGIYYLVGIILFSIVLWKKAAPLLKAAGVTFLLHGVLIIMPDQIYINLLSWIFLLISSVLLIMHSQRVLGQRTDNLAPNPEH